MDVTDITVPLDQLDSDIDKMEETVKPLIANLSEIAAKLPLLDKAKLYALAAYTIETALFNALRLQGIESKKHPIFTELTRVKQYFAKIKTAEEPPAPRTSSLDTQAAIRFIKADLADQPDINTKLKEQLAKERAKAAVQAAKYGKGKKRPAEEADSKTAEASRSEGLETDGYAEEDEVEVSEMQKAKKPRNDKSRKAHEGAKANKRLRNVKG
ncbi:unnamed protein product [Discula destructiva]